AGLAVEAHELARVLRPDLDARDVADAHGAPVDVLHDQLLEALGRAQLAEAAHGELRLVGLEPPRRHVDVLALECGAQVRDREALRGEPAVVDPDAHRVAPLAADHDARDAREPRAPLDALRPGRRREAEGGGQEEGGGLGAWLATTGSSTSWGRSERARATRSRTSLAAASKSRPSSNSTVISETCSRLSEVTCFTPSMPFT